MGWFKRINRYSEEDILKLQDNIIGKEEITYKNVEFTVGRSYYGADEVKIELIKIRIGYAYKILGKFNAKNVLKFKKKLTGMEPDRLIHKPHIKIAENEVRNTVKLIEYAELYSFNTIEKLDAHRDITKQDMHKLLKNIV